MRETWRDIRDHPHYEVSNTGSVRNRKRGRLLKPALNKPNGFYRVKLDGDNCLVHRLVMENFRGRPMSPTHICHLDGDRLNNRLTNLEWDVGDVEAVECDDYGADEW